MKVSKSKLPIYTFIAVFLVIVAVGVFALPIFLNVLQTNYFRLQADVNYRQAKSMAQFIQNRLDQGTDKESVINEFQASISGTQFDKGYVCLVDQESTNYLCHPMTMALGMPVAVKQALYDKDFDGLDLVKWENELKQGKSGGGLLHYPNQTPTEIVYFHSIPEVNWTVSSHENSERIQAEFSKIKDYLTIGSVLFGLLLAFPISFAVRKVSGRHEKQIEQKNIRISEEQKKSEGLLLNILPPSIAERMKSGEKTIVDHFKEVSVLFCDIVNFTQLATGISPPTSWSNY